MKLNLVKTPWGLMVGPESTEWYRSLPVNSEIEVDYKTESRRTSQQNRALHKWLDMLAEVMNAHGIGTKVLMEAKTLDVPMSMELCKELIWKPVQEAMLNKESTADANTTDYNAVYQVLCQTLADKLGIACPPWPTRFGEISDTQDAF